MKIKNVFGNVLRFIPIFVLALCLFAPHAHSQGTTQHSATLTWVASTTPGVSYNVYRGTVSGGPYTLLNATGLANLNYVDTTVTAGTAYDYVVTAVDANGNESVFSNQAGVTIPQNVNPPTGLVVVSK